MPRYQKAILLYNQQAGQEDAQELLPKTIAKLAPEIVEFTIIQTLKQGDAERICLERAADMDLLLIMGGDGTVHECVNGMMKQKSRPTIAILPAGTCNDLSRGLQNETFDEALDAILEGHTLAIDIGQQNEQYFSNFSGVGLITEASKEIEEETKDKFGKLGYLISAVRSLKEPQSFSYQLETEEGETSTGEAVMILAMNGKYIGTVGLFEENISLSDGFLHLFIIKEAGMTLIKNMYNQARMDNGWLNEPEGLEIFRSASFKLETFPMLDIDSDGEQNEETPVMYKLHKGELTFICGTKETDR
ncbi:diacylglycerol/lipid kinase family protein [Shouchella patagoniensis]|uniref:diacylglycerol/lipid kinase family protein n=1 Tax=Shouchella patagoniensis TaxID=228576 RepID=UPI000994956E|nr:diacylglycerol kinase family protein [Shouchella patagoniensis]